ncbi:hypothetical protein GYMLUDRAFT_37078 [Collybiopsis luxurians FD-317 M1]|nr:hypothetical protein GYMLUDRAFT_37078 [Collybiopsis luxurians FD-317 M1]
MDERLKLVASIALLSLFTSGAVSTPISSKDLLTRVITYKLPSLPSNLPRFRLTDLFKFEAALESLAHDWDSAELKLVREDGQVVVMDVVFPNGLSTTTSGLDFNPRKRKRVIDEEADSAAGSEPEEEEDDKAIQEIGGYKQSGLAGFSKQQREVYALMQKGTAKSKLIAERFGSDKAFEPICPRITKDACAAARQLESVSGICDRVHFRPVIRPHTDVSLGHCSYLNTCYSEPTYAQSPSIPPFPSNGAHTAHTLPPGARGPTSLPSGLGAGGRGKEKAPCRYLHYEVDWDGGDGLQDGGKAVSRFTKPHKHSLNIGLGPSGRPVEMLPPQWINCDVRRFDYSVLGKFHVIMADPPWDIHMSLPYGTMTDDEMRAMPIPTLQDEGLLFLWVTGRAMEVGRECLRVWGYTRIDEVIWLKTNQLQRVIRTGRTGHWLNHTKEHMLVGVKTQYRKKKKAGEDIGAEDENELEPIDPPILPKWVNKGLDVDVIVSEVRETSRKPEEVYGLIERMCPGGRKIEIFGRKHNTRPGWLTLGNQLGPDQIYEEDLAKRIKDKYPDRPIVIPNMLNVASH